MRILVITNLYPPHGLGGYEERCKVTVDELRRRGHEVIVLTSRYGVQDDQSVTEEGVHRLLTPVGFFGFPWVRAPQLFDIERSNHVALSHLAESFHPDVIHVWNMGGIGKDLLHRAHELAPLVSDISDHWVIRGIPSDPLRAWYGRHPFLGSAWKRSRHGLPGAGAGQPGLGSTYFTSRYLRDATVAADHPELRDATIIHCGIDYQRYAAPVKPAEKGRLRCCYVGRWCADKGLQTALAAVMQAGDGVTLDCFGAGDAEYTARCYAMVGKHPRVRLCGYRRPDEIPAIYQSYDCLIFPSEWGEPFALTPLEASAAGLVVAGTTTGGSGEFLKDGITARCWEAGNPQALASVLNDLAAEPAQRQRLAQTAQFVVRTQFTQAIMVNAIEQHLFRAIDQAAQYAA